MTDTSPAKFWLEEDGAIARIRLARPKANILDGEMIAALDAHLTNCLDNASLKAVLIDAEGGHFSFGASVEEHLPETCAAMLGGFHALLKKMVASTVTIVTAINGQCLGGGLELALGGNLIFAGVSARMGQPEIKLGVFAPAASCLLPMRIGQAAAEELLLSGRSINTAEAHRIGLVHSVDDDPTAAALDWITEHLLPLSASSLRFAVRAARLGVADRIGNVLDQVERLYLDELMATEDPLEGFDAFLGKRPAIWKDQ
jgi:cyclohexa-1,5-dienecarbonyl-CoA hydratase